MVEDLTSGTVPEEEVVVQDEGCTRRWLRRPQGLVAQTEWLFCLCVLVSLLLTLPAPLSSRSAPAVLLALGASLVLATAWLLRYRRRGPAVVLDVAEALATLAFAAACPVPATAFGFTFSALWLRALYGSTTRIVLYCTGVAAGLAGSLLVWPLLPHHAGAVAAAPLLGALPVSFLTVAVARHLALGLFAREQSRRRDTALVELSGRLLGITDRETIYALAWQAAARICEATPGLRAVVVRPGTVELQVMGTAGAFTAVPDRLPARVQPASTAAEVWPVQDAGPLDAAAGIQGTWVGLTMPEPQGAMLLGAPGGVSPDALVALQSMLNQVALALRTYDAHQHLELQAHTDSLTGLANRSAFTAALETALQDGQPVPTLLFLDLDDFKTVNDGLGHAAGDELLRHVAARLQTAVRTQDLCARLGGDEFAVLLPDATEEVAGAVAQRLVELVAGPVALSHGRAPVGASVGVATAGPGLDGEQLMQRADVAMYAAKARGKNRVQVFDPDLLRPDQQKAFEDELAAAADAGQLVVHYQPIVETQGGRCTAVEALVRWQHPARGLLGPQEFIPVAERSGAIVGIGARVLREACAFVAAEGLHGSPLAVHVNVSGAQLLDAGFTGVVAACLRQHGLAPKQLVLEITESMVLDSPEARSTVADLVGLGAAVAIDDFGTGYSALTTLRTLPLDIVKIDRSFVADCAGNPADHAVVEAIVQMAARLGLQTVAEGVERPEQQEFLEQVGVGATQGFLHCRPVDAAAARAWLRARAAQAGGLDLGARVIALPARRSG